MTRGPQPPAESHTMSFSQAAPLLAQPPRPGTADADLAAAADAAGAATAPGDDAVLRRHLRLVLRDDPKEDAAALPAAAMVRAEAVL